MKKPALGKGLSALISELPTDMRTIDNSITQISLSDIVPNKAQPRKNFQQESLQELAESIKNNGIIQPIVVQPISSHQYQIVVGERRFRASLLAGLEKIPAIIKNLSDDKVFTWALLENIQREDLNSLEVALSYSELMNRLDLTQEALAGYLGKSRSTIANTLRILKLPESIQQDVLNGNISEGHARTIASLQNIDEQISLRNDIIKNNLTVRDTEKKIQSNKQEKITGEKKSSYNSSIIAETKKIAANIASEIDVKVKVVPHNNYKGKFELYYSNTEEFERIKKILVAQQDKFWI